MYCITLHNNIKIYCITLHKIFSKTNLKLNDKIVSKFILNEIK